MLWICKPMRRLFYGNKEHISVICTVYIPQSTLNHEKSWLQKHNIRLWRRLLTAYMYMYSLVFIYLIIKWNKVCTCTTIIVWWGGGCPSNVGDDQILLMHGKKNRYGHWMYTVITYLIFPETLEWIDISVCYVSTLVPQLQC